MVGSCVGPEELRFTGLRRQRVEVAAATAPGGGRPKPDAAARRTGGVPAAAAPADPLRTGRRTCPAAARRRRGAEPPAHAADAGCRHGVLGQPHFDFVAAEREPVAVAQRAHLRLADGRGVAVQRRAVGRGVGDLPVAAAIGDGKMVLGQQPLGIGQHPVHPGAAADGELAARDGAGFRRHGIRAAQDREGQWHGRILTPLRRHGRGQGAKRRG